MRIEDEKAKLLLEKNESGILVWSGRLQGNHPIYIAPKNKQ